MKIQELNELRKKDTAALAKLVSEKRTKLGKALAEMKVGKEKNLKVARNLSREIAKILTIMRESELLAKLTKGTEKAEKKEEKK